MRKHIFLTLINVVMLLPCMSQFAESNKKMTDLLAKIYTQNDVPHNPFASGTRLNFFSKSFETSAHIHDSTKWAFLTMNALLENGDEKEAVKFGQFLLKRVEEFGEAPIQLARRSLALAYLREGEKTNCILDHSGESCIFPIAGRGIQNYKNGSRKAIVLYEQLLEQNPSDVESRWLLNIAYMAIGGYPRSVPKKFLIPDLDKPSAVTVKPFEDMSMQTGLNVNNLAGGSIIDDFNNDGHPDIITSSIHLKEPMLYHQNNGDGTFKDVSLQSGLGAFTGGLNLLQNDYNNDGLKDIFVLRGAWLANYGEQPNSLLRNNGDGTFTDVTVEAGILSFRPTQTATWADFNGDGWLDLFIGNETTEGVNSYPCELYVNNKNGTFSEIAKAAGCDYTLYVKGVTSGDYNNDDKPDLYLATLDGNKILLKNETEVNGPIRFTDVSDQAGLNTNITRVFTSWFWDYDNDGWLDILSCGYEFQKSLAWYAAQEALDMPMEKSGEVFLFRNKHDGTFEDVSDKVGFDKTVFAMGGNFGDINNDGYLDFYLGSGNPLYQSLVPNKMYLNIEGSSFVDVTTSARVGNLQKGHAVSFADLDNDGDQDIHIEMGGAFDGDAYANSLFINPGQADNHWIKISLEGILANKAAIGAKLRLTIEENGKTRMLYREVNSGGSFGSNPLMQSIGVGKAEIIKKLEIIWPGSKTVQVFTGINVDQNIYIRENSSSYTTKTFPVVSFTKEHHEMSKHVH